jgi:hypothetical protein
MLFLIAEISMFISISGVISGLSACSTSTVSYPLGELPIGGVIEAVNKIFDGSRAAILSDTRLCCLVGSLKSLTLGLY